MRIAVNGMGRIGRLLFRRLIGDERIEIVAVNDIMSIDNLAYLIKYDSVYGTFAGDIITENQLIKIQDKKVAVFQMEDPRKLPWKDLDIDVVLECSGSFTSGQRLKNIFGPVQKKFYYLQQGLMIFLY